MCEGLENVYIQLPTFAFWKDVNSVYLGCNWSFAQAAKLNSPSEIKGLTDYDFDWRDRFADLYQEGDKSVLDDIPLINVIEPQVRIDNKIINILVNKTCLYDPKGQKIGVIGNYIEMTNLKYQGQFNRLANNIPLTEKQAECLFLLVKGMSTKQISSKLDTSIRTIEHRIEDLKSKFQCFNKQELIERAWKLDFIRKRVYEELQEE